MFVQIEGKLIRGDIKGVEKQISRLLTTDLENKARAELHIYRAKARLLTGRPESALDEIARAGEIHPESCTSPFALELLADSHFSRFELSTVVNRTDAAHAEAVYRRLLETHADYPNIGWIQYQLARVLMSENRNTEAIELLHNALVSESIVPALSAYCYERLGFIAFYDQRLLDRAVNYLNRAVDTYPKSESQQWLVQVHLLKCRILREAHNTIDAIEEAETAVKIASRSGIKTAHAEALFAYAELCAAEPQNHQRVVDALERFLQVTRRPPGADVTYSRTYEMLGDAYTALGSYDRAVNAYYRVLQFNPNHPWEISIYHRIGRAYYLKGNYEKSIAAIDYALKIARENGEFTDYQLYDTFANAHFALGHYSEAAEAYERALNLNPNNPDHLQKIKHYHQLSLQMAGQAL